MKESSCLSRGAWERVFLEYILSLWLELEVGDQDRTALAQEDSGKGKVDT